jgi:O-acetyl-ADP-ribose deacetylase (regulator of RNase III)
MHQFSRWLVDIPRRERLGRTHFAEVTTDTYIASLVAQEGYGVSSSPRIRYAPLERCFCEVAKCALANNASVHLPRIGTGQSGGAWNTVEEIIRDTLIAKGVQVTIYDLPPKRQAAELLP